MRIQTALNHRDRIIINLRDDFGAAEIYALTSARLNDRTKKTFSSLPVNIPGWVIEYARGYRAALYDLMDKHSLVFGAFFKGKFYSVEHSRSDYYGKHDITPIEFNKESTLNGFYWANSIKNGTAKPYYVNT